MIWRKNENNQWYIATNDIQFADFKENLKSTDKLNIIRSNDEKPVIYIPTHNIHDVYEWFRLFKDSHLITDNTDKYGFAIHGFFNKNRSQSIQGYFPNLIEVKASSSDTLKYYDDGTDYFRTSVDYIENLAATFDTLTIDNVEVLDTEKVLLKYLYTETLDMFPIIEFENQYYINVDTGFEDRLTKLKKGNPCRIKYNTNLFAEDTISDLQLITADIGFGSNDYVIITLSNTYDSIISVADFVLGDWTIDADNREQHGVYQYLNKELVYLSEMSDKYKTYNQIVYTYQGDTNANKQFYLRRIEDTTDPSKYSLYPYNGFGAPLIYSEGEAYLIKCRLEYTLDSTAPTHPSGAPPYSKDSDTYKLLFLDHTQARKILGVDANGIGAYKLNSSIIIGNYDTNYDEVSDLVFNMNYNSTVTSETTGKTVTNTGLGVLSTAQFVSSPSSLFIDPYFATGTFDTSVFSTTFGTPDNLSTMVDSSVGNRTITPSGDVTISTAQSVSATSSARFNHASSVTTTILELLFTGTNGSVVFNDTSTFANPITTEGDPNDASIDTNRLKILGNLGTDNGGLSWNYTSNFDTTKTFSIDLDLEYSNLFDKIPLYSKSATVAASPVGNDLIIYLTNNDTIDIYTTNDTTLLVSITLSTSAYGSALSPATVYNFRFEYDSLGNTLKTFVDSVQVNSTSVTLTNTYTGKIYVGATDGDGSGVKFFSGSDYFIDNYVIQQTVYPTNAYVTVTNSPAISFATDFEIKFSFRLESGIAAGKYIYFITKDTGSNKFRIYLENNTHMHLEIGSNTISIGLFANWGATLSNNTWYNVTFTHLGTNNTLKLNGSTIETNTWSIPNTSANWILGDNTALNDTVWYMDDLTVGAQIFTFNTSYLKLNYHSDINFNLDFTMQFSIRITEFNNPIVIFNKSNDSLGIYDFKVKLNNLSTLQIFLNQNTTASISVSHTFNLNTWYKIEIIRKLGVLKVEIDDVDKGINSTLTINNNSVYDMYINADSTTSLISSQSKFFIDDFSITKHTFAFDPHTLTFKNQDGETNDNVLVEYENDILYGTGTLPTYKFQHRVLLNTDQTYSRTFLGSSQVTITQLVSTTRFKGTYVTNPKFRVDDSPIVSDSVSTFNVGDFVNIKIEFKKDGEFYTALEEQFVITAKTQLDATAVEFAVFPQLDANFMLEYASYISGTDLVRLTIECVNVYGDLIYDYIENEDLGVEKLLAAINKTVLGKLYSINSGINNDEDYYLTIDNVKQNHRWKWSNHAIEITTTEIETSTTNTDYQLEHIVDSNIRKYFYQYDIVDYLTNYLDVSTPYLGQNTQVTFTYSNVLNSANRFAVEGGNRNGLSGNIIYFGSNHKTAILDNIKPSTLVKFDNTTTVYTKNITVKTVEWDDELQLGTITTLSDITIPSNGNNIQMLVINDITAVSTYLKTVFNKNINIKGDTALNDFNYTTHPDYKPDTASYAYAMLNYGRTNSTGALTKNTDILEHISGIVYKEYNEPKISFLKRDKYFDFGNTIINCVVKTNANLNLASGSSPINGVAVNIGDLIIVGNQTTTTENGIYIYRGVGVALVRYLPFNNIIFWQDDNTGNIYRAVYTDPLVLGSSVISFTSALIPTLKRDNRLTMRPIEIAKLGVDNKTQPWQKIYYKYDSLELEENKVDITIGINNRRRIRFIDGLTENNITNNIGGQGQYSWILNDDVIVDNAVVGCTQTNGPGTGQLIWYTGTWENGVWVDGIWIQGTWKDGTWLNGEFNTYQIQDFYNYVTIDYSSENIILSTWESGTWVDGNFNNGTILTINWLNGTFNNGVINDGAWQNGTFKNGVIKFVEWFNGVFNGGDFETGIWYNGSLNQLDAEIPARFGIGARSDLGLFLSRAIWYQGIFTGGEFHSGDNTTNNASIWYTGTFESGKFYGGTFVSGNFNNSIWYNGVFLGGYKITSFVDLSGSNKQLIIDPNQYENVLFDLTTQADPDYQTNTAHNLDKYIKDFVLLGTPTVVSTFSWNAFANIWHEIVASAYPLKQYVNNSATDTKLTLSIDAYPADTVYVAENISSNIPSGSPFICAMFTNSTWKNGLFVNGYIEDSVWEMGNFLNGYAYNITFGVNSYAD